ncbi:hypothetical protein D3C76_921590 [compost metagenome]
MTFVLDRIPDRHDRLTHPSDRLVQRGDATLQFVALLERWVDQHHCALLRRRQESSRHQPAVALVHGDASLAGHVGLEQATVFRMQFVEQQAILRTGQAPRQLRRAWVVAQLAVRVERPHRLQIISHQLRQIVAIPQTADALLPFAGAAGFVAQQVVETDTGMAVEVGERCVLARHQGEQAGEDGVFQHVGMVAGMVGVAIVHERAGSLGRAF